jgi:hypothetical protein
MKRNSGAHTSSDKPRTNTRPQNLKELNLQFLKSPPIRTKNKGNRTAHYLNSTKNTQKS